MDGILNNILGGKKPSEEAAPSLDSDFDDFEAFEAPEAEPSPTQSPFTPVPGGAKLDPTAAEPTGVPYTKWYNVHERHSLSEFRLEGYILAMVVTIFIFHAFGASTNRGKARKWMRAHAPVLRREFASVGFDGIPKMTTMTDTGKGDGDAAADDGSHLIKEKSLFEFEAYATGRQNVAFVDVNMLLAKRFNPIMHGIELLLGLVTETFGVPQDTLEAISYPFDGREAKTVPTTPGAPEPRVEKSTYDNFVWAIVNKEKMQKAREDRYDLSITLTKDHNKLPSWLTVMSESAEITDALLTPELIEVVTKAGDLLEYLIISDQPMDKPTTIDETTPRKRIFLRYRLPSGSDYADLVPLFEYFVRLTDTLVRQAHFRPEVLRKVRNVRDETIAQIRKADDDAKAEERNVEMQKTKKARRDEQLKGMDAKAQKKFLEKEREKELKKQQRKSTMRG